MRAMQLNHTSAIEENPLMMVDRAKPEPGEGEVLLRVNVCGLCHTDLHTVEGEIIPPSFPLIPGHQVVGTVAAVGAGVCGQSVGDRVGVPWLYRACGECEYCRRGEENLCPQARFTGFHVDGGYAQHMIAEARYLLPIPDEIGDENAAPLLCAGIIGFRSLHKADLQPGERLGLVGFGASAHLAIQVARYWDCEVYVFTRSEGHRRLAEELGAAWVGGSEDRPPKLLDRAIIFAPLGELVPMVLEKIRPGGTLAINAIHMSLIPEMEYALIYGERTLRSVANATYQDGVQFLHLAAQIPIRVSTKLYELGEANQALMDLKQSRIDGAGVLKI
ncbi:MAG TPA: zinc-dependent alcohol dehydrogenase family protein [Anaerolineales bacterium]|nr:zinc-dependent alcohol dehydrogenase family protein [Anaerolineales bacterium]